MTTCAVPGCTRPAGGRSGYCRPHRDKLRRLRPISGGSARPECRVPDCGRPVACVRDGLCMTHYQAERRRRPAFRAE